jgi:hypothetical protein
MGRDRRPHHDRLHITDRTQLVHDASDGHADIIDVAGPQRQEGRRTAAVEPQRVARRIE